MFADALIWFAKRNPGRHLGDYMERFWIKRPGPEKKRVSARVHHTLRSDYDRALHDHPWWNVSLVLRGGYWEIVPGDFQAAHEQYGPDNTFASIRDAIQRFTGGAFSRDELRELREYGIHWRGPGAVVRRKAEQLHRLVIPDGSSAWSLFVMGPKVREWGFQTPEGWIDADTYKAQMGREV